MATSTTSGDLERGNPHIISAFPSPDSVAGYDKVKPNPLRLINERVADDYIALTQRPGTRLGSRLEE